VGYARVSLDKQDEQRQLKMLVEDGVNPHAIYKDHAQSGAKRSRPYFDRMLANLSPGDLVTVSELDRLGRDAGHVILTISDLRQRGIHVRSIADGIDSTTDAGEMLMGLLAVLAQMERRFIQRRTKSGLAAAKAQGRTGGRPRALDTKQAKLAVRLVDEGEPVKEVAKTLGVSQATIYRYVADSADSESSSTSQPNA